MHHQRTTTDPTASEVRIVVSRTLVAWRPSNGAEVARNAALTLTPASLGSTTQNRVGRSQYADPYLDGAVDGLRLYSRALAASEIAALASSGT